jgi:hypothetical protein
MARRRDELFGIGAKRFKLKLIFSIVVLSQRSMSILAAMGCVFIAHRRVVGKTRQNGICRTAIGEIGMKIRVSAFLGGQVRRRLVDCILFLGRGGSLPRKCFL